jgi:hypothetical protein
MASCCAGCAGGNGCEAGIAGSCPGACSCKGDRSGACGCNHAGAPMRGPQGGPRWSGASERWCWVNGRKVYGKMGWTKSGQRMVTDSNGHVHLCDWGTKTNPEKRTKPEKKNKKACPCWPDHFSMCSARKFATYRYYDECKKKRQNYIDCRRNAPFPELCPRIPDLPGKPAKPEGYCPCSMDACSKCLRGLPSSSKGARGYNDALINCMSGPCLDYLACKKKAVGKECPDLPKQFLVSGGGRGGGCAAASKYFASGGEPGTGTGTFGRNCESNSCPLPPSTSTIYCVCSTWKTVDPADQPASSKLGHAGPLSGRAHIHGTLRMGCKCLCYVKGTPRPHPGAYSGSSRKGSVPAGTWGGGSNWGYAGFMEVS